MSEFKLCKELGLEVYNKQLPPAYVLAADLERILEKGVRVYGALAHAHTWHKTQGSEDNYTALMIGTTPIVRDTAEGLLRKIVAHYDEFPGADGPLLERAKRLLGEG